MASNRAPADRPGMPRGRRDWHTELNQQMWATLEVAAPDQLARVQACDTVMIEPEFIGFLGTYFLLAKLIPRHWTIVDLGCAYAAQAWYFRHHAHYIGVDVGELASRFSFENTSHVVGGIVDFADWCDRECIDTSEVFAISNYVPPWYGYDRGSLHGVFRNLYVYYPHGGFDPMKAALAAAAMEHSHA